MWAASMPYYSEYKRRGSAAQVKTGTPDASSNPSVSVSSGGDSRTINLAEMLEPAVDGPPSPERIRQLSKQMKRASHLNRPQQGHRAVSSGSSSLRSMTAGDRQSWEQALENISVSRRSSQRSATSSNPPRDRADSIQVLGKNIFHRRGKSKRDSSSHSSSSSMYSSEVATDSSLSLIKDTLFARRRPSRDETASMQKKMTISGPFNFQHVTHTHREQLVNRNRMELASELAAVRSPPGPNSAPNGNQNDGMHFPNFSSENVNENGPATATSTAPVSRPPLLSRATAPASKPRRLLKHALSQDQLRTSPPRPTRPPRSPPIPPVPPVRVSSRQMNHMEQANPFGSFTMDRPQTSGDFRREHHFISEESISPTERPPATSYGFTTIEDQDEESVAPEVSFSHALTTPDEAAWPLSNSTASFETPLPDVPEEEEQCVVSGRQRSSLRSNNSLRGSHSVPVLRQRPMSAMSDTLGQFDLSKVHRLTSGRNDEGAVTSPLRDSWEDDIDYCYEHEADANFDYEWDRPSLDGAHGCVAPPVQIALVDDDELAEANPEFMTHSSPGMLSASHFDMPSLSPSSQTSTAQGHEALTPSMNPGNFSLPRGDNGRRPSQLHVRADSQASSFKECHGFNLSPSLLIPTDYHQQMLLTEKERQEYPEDDDYMTHSVGSILGDDASQQSPMSHQRASTSTMMTASTSRTDTTSERHISANSTWTTLTRLTSSTSLNKAFADGVDLFPPKAPSVDLFTSDDTEETASPTADEKDEVPELPFPPVLMGRRVNHKSHASESLVRDEEMPLKSADGFKMRRPRARTASLGQAPPIGQYALFPRSYVKGTGDRI